MTNRCVTGMLRRRMWALVASCLLIPTLALAQEPPTFSKDISRIFQAKCESCHRPNSMAPMSLVAYEDVRPWVRSIRNRVARREMPPWHLDTTVGIQRYKNDSSLSADQITTILKWVDAGAPRGNPADLPPPMRWADDEWTIGKPDLIITSPERVMPAAGSDMWIDHVVETGLTEDRYIQAIETRPSKEGRRVVHHASTFLIQTGDSTVVNNAGQPITIDEAVGARLGQFAPGKPGDIFPENTGILMKAGSRVRFNVHYYASGEETRARTSVGVVFYPKGVVPKYRVIDPNMGALLTDIDIPPNTVTRHDHYFPLRKPVRIISYQPHMHMRGKAQTMEAIYPDGRTEILSSVDRFDFNWHIPYIFEDDAAPLLPAGTIIHYIGIHDNTASNPRNPDPTQWVGYGDRSIDDMFQVHVNLVYLEEEDYLRQVAERKAKASEQQR